MQVERSLDAVYGHRFDDADEAAKQALWQEVTRYLQRFVDPGSVVLDLACDRGHFIRCIRAREKWATDLRDVSAYLGDDVRFVQGDGLALADLLPNGHFDVVFMSNYLEHLPSGEAVIEQFRVVRDLLRPGGRAIVLQPNIRLVGGRYWDFIDHTVALTERSLAEACELAGLTADRTIVRFLPYTTKSRLPQSRRLVRAYLAFRPAWALLGKQTLFIARR
jgi:SAM-dependent methyltransferase